MAQTFVLRMRRELAKEGPWVPGPYEKVEGEEQDAAAKAALEKLGYTEGQTVDPSWSWTCPEHMEQRLDGPTSRCYRCKSPPLMINENQIDEIFSDKMPKILASVA